MQEILCWYLNHKDWIALIKDVVFFFGAYQVLTFILRRKYVIKTQEIDQNLQFRDKIEEKLQGHVLAEIKNGIKDIGIRFVHWKNYPGRLENDAYKHLLRVDQDDQFTIPSGWLDNTGINFQEHLWFTKTSIYVDDDGIFFFAKEGESFKGFQELQNKCLVTHLPFSSIINLTFRS